MKQNQHFITTLQSEEQKLYELITKKISLGTMIDVGAHQGIVTELFLMQGWKAYAFEPVVINMEKLKQRLGDQDNLSIRAEAVSDISGVKSFHLALNADGSIHEYYHSLENIKEDSYHKKGQTISIETVSLNDLVHHQEIPQNIDFLKIDTEGHDLTVLKGADQLRCLVISVGFWGDKYALGKPPSPLDEIIRFLQNRGYKRYIVIEKSKDNKTYFLYSSIKNIKDDSWGNILFFHDSQDSLYQDAIALCEEIKLSHQTQQEGDFLINILKHFHHRDEEIFIVYIGTYRGDFTSHLIHNFPRARAILFEPTPNSFSSLLKKFADTPPVKVINCAISNYEGDDVFYLLEDGATNSLLHPVNESSSEIKISVTTLDNYWQEKSNLRQLDILKIDTQGNDFKVLQGAKKVIKKYSPCILVEVIFIQLYQTQDSYYEIIKCMHEYEYSLANILNIHYSERGILAFADLLFLPNHKFKQIKTTPNQRFSCHDVEYLLTQNQLLQQTCDERLAIINTLDQAAKERLTLIESLDTEVKRLKHELAKVKSKKKDHYGRG